MKTCNKKNNYLGSCYFSKGGGEYLIALCEKDVPKSLSIRVTDKISNEEWAAHYGYKYIEEVTTRTGNFKSFNVFVEMIKYALLKKSESVKLDLVSELQINEKFPEEESKEIFYISESAELNNNIALKRKFLQVTYEAEFDKVNYHLPLNYIGLPSSKILQKQILKMNRELSKLKIENESLKNNRMKNESTDKCKKNVEYSIPIRMQMQMQRGVEAESEGEILFTDTEQIKNIKDSKENGNVKEKEKVDDDEPSVIANIQNVPFASAANEKDKLSSSNNISMAAIEHLMTTIKEMEENMTLERAGHNDKFKNLQFENHNLSIKLAASEKAKKELEKDFQVFKQRHLHSRQPSSTSRSEVGRNLTMKSYKSNFQRIAQENKNFNLHRYQSKRERSLSNSRTNVGVSNNDSKPKKHFSLLDAWRNNNNNNKSYRNNNNLYSSRSRSRNNLVQSNQIQSSLLKDEKIRMRNGSSLSLRYGRSPSPVSRKIFDPTAYVIEKRRRIEEMNLSRLLREGATDYKKPILSKNNSDEMSQMRNNNKKEDYFKKPIEISKSSTYQKPCTTTTAANSASLCLIERPPKLNTIPLKHSNDINNNNCISSSSKKDADNNNIIKNGPSFVYEKNKNEIDSDGLSRGGKKNVSFNDDNGNEDILRVLFRGIAKTDSDSFVEEDQRDKTDKMVTFMSIGNNTRINGKNSGGFMQGRINKDTKI